MVATISSLHLIYVYEYTFMVLGIFSFLIWGPIYLSNISLVRVIGTVPSLSGVIFNSTFVMGLSTVISTYSSEEPGVFVIYPTADTPSAIHVLFYIVLIVLVLFGHLVYL